MATLHVTEAEAVRDIADLLLRVRSGDEVVIRNGDHSIGSIMPPETWTPPGEDPEYDAWVCAKVQQAIDDPRPKVDRDTAQARFLEYRKALLSRSGVLNQ